MWKTTNENIDSNELTLSIHNVDEVALTGAIAIGSVEPWIFTAYVALSNGCIWFTSQPTTDHACMIKDSVFASVAMWNAPDNMGASLLGLQFRGSARVVHDPVQAKIGVSALHSKFPMTVDTIPGVSSVVGSAATTSLFVVNVSSGKLQDTARFEDSPLPIEWRDSYESALV